MEGNLNPEVGMEFDSVSAAWNFWRMYGGKMGFGVRKNNHNKSKKDSKIITSMIYVCSKEGFRGPDKRDVNTKNPREETRTGCRARITFKLVLGKYQVKEFIKDHNHELHPLKTIHMLPSQQQISNIQAYEIELAEDSDISQKDSFDLMSLNAAGKANIEFTQDDTKNYLESRRARNMAYEEVGTLIQYFQKQSSENPSFFHAYQLDAKEQITNIFWADERMLIDYGLFGDVVSLDTAFGTNKKNMPLAVFCGLNDHKGIVIYGAALLYDETAESFNWLFQTFLQAHGYKKPLTIFTDQDAAMTRALFEVMPDTAHGLCTWHMMRNATKYLARLGIGSNNARLHTTHRFRDLSQKFISISTEACKSMEGTSLMLSVMSNLEKQLAELHLTRKDSDTDFNVDVNGTAVPAPQCTSQATRFKQRDDAKNKRCFKSCVKGEGKKKKIVTSNRRNELQLGVSCSVPPTPLPELSFTEILMAPFDHPTPSLEKLQFSNDFSHTPLRS